MSIFPYKGWGGGGFLPSFKGFLPDFFACKPDLEFFYSIINTGKKISPIFPRLFRTFRATQIWTLQWIPSSPYTIPPLSHILPLWKADEAFWLYYYKFHSDFLSAGIKLKVEKLRGHKVKTGMLPRTIVSVEVNISI